MPLNHHRNATTTHNLVEDEFNLIIGTDIDQINPDDYYQTIGEELEYISLDRLILVKLHISLINVGMEELKRIGGSSSNVHMQFHVLNLLDYLYANLLPVPSLLNLIMRH